MDYNTAINPQQQDGAFTVEVMPCRSANIRKTVARTAADGIGGMTDLKTGTVWVPIGNTAKERTIRYHEAMHATYTPVKGTPKDMLDQALEDARLHRHCSRSAMSQFQRARRDELTVALTELRQVKRAPILSPVHSLTTLRAMAILRAGSRLHLHSTREVRQADAHRRLLESVVGRLGTSAMADFDTALALLVNVSNWDKARKVVRKYFGKDFASSEPPPMPKNDSKDKDEYPYPHKDKEEDKEGESIPVSARVDETGEEGDKPATPDSEDESTGETGKDEKEGAPVAGESTKTEMAPPMPVAKPAAKPKAMPDEYTADLTPDCDRDAYARMDECYPLKLYIRRMDMGCNRVKLSMGRKAPLPVISGRKILAGRLAGALVNPSMRVFARSIAIGGNGTILIDASGSMCIPEHKLIEFLSKAPALTLAFYNAPADHYGNGRHKTKHGNIYIYAANGYRASAPSIGDSAPEYGPGNMIDYQAMAWLIKQPAPHYFVCDSCYTGPWARAASRLERKLVDSKDVIMVRGLEEMVKILDALD